MIRLAATLALCAACGDEYAYTTSDGLRVTLLDGLDVEQSDVELATSIFKLTLPEFGRKVRPGFLTFGNDIKRLCPGMPNVAGCSQAVTCNGCMDVLWLDGFGSNAYFHEQLHVTGYRLTGISDGAHAVFPWAKIADMHAIYLAESGSQ